MPCIVYILLCCYLYVGTEVILFPQRFCCLCITRLSVFMTRDAHLRLLLFADLLRGVDCRFWFFFHSFGMV